MTTQHHHPELPERRRAGQPGGAATPGGRSGPRPAQLANPEGVEGPRRPGPGSVARSARPRVARQQPRCGPAGPGSVSASTQAKAVAAAASRAVGGTAGWPAAAGEGPALRRPRVGGSAWYYLARQGTRCSPTGDRARAGRALMSPVARRKLDWLVGRDHRASRRRTPSSQPGVAEEDRRDRAQPRAPGPGTCSATPSGQGMPRPGHPRRVRRRQDLAVTPGPRGLPEQTDRAHPVRAADRERSTRSRCS
ncbi:hypothetical protein HBB16_16540 [Pseudonocardia sp. MCCB 268]|nr:hypothetical protein [Pseudonocardia cytotoxica]